MPDYTITEVTDTREWQGRKGSFIDYKMVVRGSDNVEQRVVWTRKPTSPEPQVGESHRATIEEETKDKKDGGTFTVKKFKPESSGQPRRLSPQKALGAPQNGLSRDDYWLRKEQRDIEAEPRISRAHAQEMALRYAAVLASLSSASGKPGAWSLDVLREFTDWFQADTYQASAPDFPGDDGSLPQFPDTHAVSSLPEAGDGAEKAPPPVPPVLPAAEVEKLFDLTQKLGIEPAEAQTKLVALGVPDPTSLRAGLSQLTPSAAKEYWKWAEAMGQTTLEKA